MNSRRVKILIIAGLISMFLGVLFFLLRGPYLSNSVKRILVPVLENATQERVLIDKAVINLFPFYVQVKGFKLFDKDGNRLLWIAKSRAYIDILALLTREIRIRKLTLKEPALTINETDVHRITDNLRKSALVGEKGQYSVTLKNIQLTDGNVSFITADKLSSFSGSTLYMDMAPKGSSYLMTVLMKKGTLKLANQSELEGSFDGKFKIKKNKVHIAELNILSSGSSFSADGDISLSEGGRIEDGSLSVKTSVTASAINLIYSLKQQKDALLSFEGFVRLLKREDSEWPGLAVDLKTDSRFYLESLMEILKVDHNITGELSIKGTITGTFPNLEGKGQAKLTNAVLETLPLDEVEGELTYKDNKFALHGFKAHTLDGIIEGDGHILIPSGNYMADAQGSDINSPKFFKFINWEPPFPEGKLSGDFKLYHENGHGMEIIADVDYISTTHTGGNILDRLTSAGASLELKDHILTLTDTVLSTGNSDLYLDGTINLDGGTLALNLELESEDASDLSGPYYSKFSAPIRFGGTAAGPVRAPVITGRAESTDGSVNGIRFTKASADLKYQTNSLAVDRLVVTRDDSECDVSGIIEFRKAEGLFSFKAPYYKAGAECRNVDIGPFVKEFYREIPVSARVSGKASFEGDADNFVSPGEMVSANTQVYGQGLDKVTVKYELRPREIEFKSVKAVRAGSDLEAKGTLFFNKKYSVSVLSDRIRLKDLSAFRDSPVDMTFGLAVNGAGTLNNPDLKFSLAIGESSFLDTPMGKGEITGTLNDDKLLARGSFIDGLIISEGDAVLADKIKWNVNSRLREGRYDFLLKGLLKEVPEDFLLSLEGRVSMQGEGDRLSVKIKLNSAAVSLYGYDLKNREDVDIELIDNEIFFKSLVMAGNKGDLNAAGALKLNNSYNLQIKGNVEIAPLRALSDKIVSLRGMGSFKIDVIGAWKRPEIYGEVRLRDATATVTPISYKIGPLDGTFFLKKDRVTFDSVHSKFAGGTIDLSGVGYLDGLALKRLSLSADIDGIKIRPSEGLSTELGGKLFYDNSSRGSSLTGNIDISKARYTKRIEWKSWLLG
ncbi:MAG: hypothetical protein HZC49_03335 [Nitrospirae bacterium]|nr:hypothetical protein [Nitrospirota bacterium]